jgi:tRNA threonylcarbamoyladenosine biosynthesis protein TsaE
VKPLSKEYVSGSAEQTVELGRRIARELPEHALVMLIGNLGAGKTTLAKGIISGLGLADADEVASPTFTLIHEYGEGPELYHIDLYRLDRAEQVLALGFDEILSRKAIILLEWGERFPELLPPERIEIHLRTLDENRRSILVSRLGQQPNIPG